MTKEKTRLKKHRTLEALIDVSQGFTGSFQRLNRQLDELNDWLGLVEEMLRLEKEIDDRLSFELELHGIDERLKWIKKQLALSRECSAFPFAGLDSDKHAISSANF